MATTYSATAFGEFKTAYLQREVVHDLVCAASGTLKVGQIVKINSSGKLEALAVSGESTAAAAEAAIAAAVQQGMFIIAQSDQTLEYGHVPVEYADYKYSPNVVTVADATKRFALYMITNVKDIIVNPVTTEVTA